MILWNKDFNVLMFGPEAKCLARRLKGWFEVEKKLRNMLRNQLTREMMSALQNFCISSKVLLGPREEVNRIVTWRLVKRKKQPFCVLRGEPILECTVLGLNLHLDLSAKAICFLSTHACRGVYSIQTGTSRIVRPIKGSLGFRINNADGDRIEMLTQCSFRRQSMQNPCYTNWRQRQNVPEFRNCNCPHAPCCWVDAA